MQAPPFIVSPLAINLIAEISALLERYAIALENEDGLRLRKANRIKTIHSSLAIEGNTLSEDEVADIINGKNVVAPIRQIQEVRNAIKAYEHYKVPDKVPNKSEENVLDLLRKFPHITASEMAAEIGIINRAVRKIIRGCCRTTINKLMLVGVLPMDKPYHLDLQKYMNCYVAGSTFDWKVLQHP